MQRWFSLTIILLSVWATPAQSKDVPLSQLKQALAAKAKTAQELEEKALTLQEQLATLKSQIETIRADTDNRHAEIQQTLNALVRLRQAPPHTMLLPGASPRQQAQASLMLAQLLTRVHKRKLELQEQARYLNATEKLLVLEQEQLDDTQQQLALEREALARLIAKRERQQPPPPPPVEALAKAIAGIVADDGNVDALINQTEQQQKAIPLPPYSGNKVTSAAKSSDEQSFAEFVDVTSPQAPPLRRGALLMPVAGRITTRYGERSALGHTVRGLTLRTNPDATVIAPYAGTVIFSGPFRGYGTMLIIRHGAGYHSVLAGMATISTGVGEWLVAGEPIGQMPSDAPVQLYFELRRQGTAVNPLPWLANTPKNNAS